MKPNIQSQKLLGVTRSKAKMWEYDIPVEHHIAIPTSPDKLFPLTIALIGDVAAEINRGHENTDTFKTLKEQLLFAADFFNALYESKLHETLSPQLRLLAAAAYYLCEMQGNAKVLAISIKYKELTSQSDGLDMLLLWILQGDISTAWKKAEGTYAKFIVKIPPAASLFYKNNNSTQVEQMIDDLRQKVYSDGTPEQLLLGDIIAAVTRRKISNASIRVLPYYTGISVAEWLPALNKPTFIREFWPAQHLLGKVGILQGNSAVVQMPTSAGKTKSIELILRSAFLSKRATIAIIVAPFRALCHEIKDSLQTAFQNEDVSIDSLSDVLQTDFAVAEYFGLSPQPKVISITPEKLLYVLRHHPEIATHLKLIIFDEGHQFDTGKRGITYELLLTSLKRFIPEDAQKILISAVISNAKEIGKWLNDSETVASGSGLAPTLKTIGFASWQNPLGQIKYTKGTIDDFFVPRVIEEQGLQKQGKERTVRKFPKKGKGQDIALFLGLKLCGKGGIAIFCGRKDTAINICERLMEIIGRGYSVENLKQFSNAEEILALAGLCEENLGINSIEAGSARIGVFAHHRNIPHGIRIAVEHAMREDKIRFVICTSTLAQGVNLPIRYLIVTSFYQGRELIKVRDFHNLIGRAGRAGKHIEGSILFAETDVYDKKYVSAEKWRWEKAQHLLNPDNSEKCVSSLLAFFKPIMNIYRKPLPLGFEKIIDIFIEDSTFDELAGEIERQVGASGFTISCVLPQLAEKRQLLESIENFLLAHWDDIANNPAELSMELAKQTLAFHFANEETKANIIKIFQSLAINIAGKIQEPQRKNTFGKTLYGVHMALNIENWVNENKQALLSTENIDTFIDLIWDEFCLVIKDTANNGSLFTKFDPADARKDLLSAWVKGISFFDLLRLLEQQNVSRIYGTKRRSFTVEDMVDIGENTFAFDGTLAVGAIIEFFESSADLDPSNKERFQIFQKRFKYGLPTVSAITVYELGFSDRVLSQKIASLFSQENCNKEMVLSELQNPDIVKSIQDFRLPLYYDNLLSRLT